MAVSGLSTGSAPAGRRAGTRGNLPTGTTVATYPGSVTSPTMSRPDRPRPSPSARSRVTSVVLAALAMLAVVCPPALADDGDRMRRPRHSSDGIRGPIAPTVTDDRRPVVTDEVTRRIAPGVVYRRWDQTDARGRIRAYLLAVRYTVDGGGFGYAWPGRVPQRHKLRGMVADLGGVAGVNGDFFDIADTGAPLGIGHTDRFLTSAPTSGWNSAFFLPPGGIPTIGTLPLTAEIRGRPGIGITEVNPPTVRPDGVGVYTRRWGRTLGDRVTDGETRHVREVVIKDGVVRAVRSRLSQDRPITGRILIGRGAGARALGRLEVGDPAEVRWSLAEPTTVAITGNEFLIRDGVIVTSDDGEMHPRTAVGIDVDTQRVYLLVIDGRQDFSRGYTMLELARMLKHLGCEDALNLDGGGSSTMVARRRSGRIGVMNSPSDGEQRPVPNGLLVYADR